MEKIITFDTLRSFAYCNDQICARPIRGMVLRFFGLGGMEMFDKDPDEGVFYAEKGILYVVPYNNPWCWMNDQAVRYTDEILDVLFEAFQLPDNLPIVSSGGSMGGQASLVYARYAKRTPTAVVSNCPVCDLPYHFTERPDLPRTLYSACFSEQGRMQDALEARSPLHLSPVMPDIAYHIIHCGADQAVNIDKHSRKFVEAMRICGRKITFEICEGRGHCDLDEAYTKKYLDYCVDEILNSPCGEAKPVI